jgi:hypothetical protein
MLKIQHAIPFLLLLAGCAVRQAAPRTWRFTDRTLIPPGVTSPDVAVGSFKAPLVVRPNCLESEALTIRRRRSSVAVTVHREALLRQARGWLAEWIDRAESEGCIPRAQGPLLAARILESLPLPAGAALRLTRADGMPNYVELTAGNRLEVISPLVSAGAGVGSEGARAMQVTGDGRHLQVEMKANPALLGVEIAWYDVMPKPDGHGFAIVPASVVINVQGSVEARDAPTKNYFQFAPEIGFYRLFYKSDQSEVLALAATRADLPTDADFCDRPGGTACFNVPHGVGVNPYMRIEVNGSAMPVGIGATVRSVLQAAKQRPEIVLPALRINKPFAGRPALVEFDRGKQDILNLVLTGNEQIRW